MFAIKQSHLPQLVSVGSPVAVPDFSSPLSAGTDNSSFLTPAEPKHAVHGAGTTAYPQLGTKGKDGQGDDGQPVAFETGSQADTDPSRAF